MARKFDAIYEAGVLRPIKQLPLEEDTQVTVQLTEPDDGLDHAFMNYAREQVSQMSRTTTREEVRKLLRKDSESWAEAVIRERAEGR